MKNFKYIIVGGGMTGSSAVMGIRKADDTGTIAMFTDEKNGPYNRPPLTKGLWTGMQMDDIIRPINKYSIQLFLETPIIEINPSDKTVLTDQGSTYHYQKLLLATGGSPVKLPNAPAGVIYYRTNDDYLNLRELSKTKQDFCVIGGGFIGSEIAATISKIGCKVTMIFPEMGICGLIFPDALSEFFNHYYHENGVQVLSGHLVDSIEKDNDKYLVRYKRIQTQLISERNFDAVIIGIGIKPNTNLAKEAGITVENGILVNETLQTNDPNIFAAGDVANYFHKGLNKRVRVEHEDNANQMGVFAGLNMSGEAVPYHHFPFFYSDLYDRGYEAIGEFNKSFEIYEDWIEPYKKGTIFYLHENQIRGLMFWNLWGKLDQGREIISTGKKFKPSDLVGLFLDN